MRWVGFQMIDLGSGADDFVGDGNPRGVEGRCGDGGIVAVAWRWRSGRSQSQRSK